MRDNNALGFRDAILNPDLALKDIVQRLPGTTLSVLTVGRLAVMPHEVIKSTRFAEVLDEARRDYEWIILDTAPLVLAPDCLMMGRSVDGFVIIVCAHKTSRKEIGEALDILGPSKLLGLVFNHDDSLLDSYGYRTYLSALRLNRRTCITVRKLKNRLNRQTPSPFRTKVQHHAHKAFRGKYPRSRTEPPRDCCHR